MFLTCSPLAPEPLTVGRDATLAARLTDVDLGDAVRDASLLRLGDKRADELRARDLRPQRLPRFRVVPQEIHRRLLKRQRRGPVAAVDFDERVRQPVPGQADLPA